MTKILTRDEIRDDEWQRFGDEQIEIANALILDVATMREHGAELKERGIRLALEVGGEEAPADYASLLADVDMVVVRFRHFTDGRGFSSARELREHYRFVGILRAAGPFIPDQMAWLARVGFDAWELPDHHRTEDYRRELRRFAGAYQELPGDGAIDLCHRS